ncbi:NAD(P)/FAD-dependent oxidoreductase [Terriglobus sp. 2YAB30_2]|uniref:FAD/NAD(P)-dependent oxidoreductase n=1 Tax=unclassified Terriglobus TaxID=2628988 RepID=UPI003F951BF2
MKPADVLVIGAGPAGLAAATAASRNGCRVAVLDDNPAAGGQIWRADITRPHHEDPARGDAIAAFHTSGAALLPGRRIVDVPSPSTLLAEAGGHFETYRWDRLILATGARERFLPFPGWTLPGVFGAGGLQALVKGGYPVAGKRIVVAGTGPLLLAVAAHLREYGASIVTVAEQASFFQMLPFAASLLRSPSKLLQGASYRKTLGITPYQTACWPVAAQGGEVLRSVTLTNGRRTWTVECDLLACGFHLVPNTELAQLLGCTLQSSFVQVDSQQQTSVAGIYCAGEPTGIAGVDAAQVQGEIAGLAAADCSPLPMRLLTRRAKEAAFGRRLTHAFRLRSEVLRLASQETIVCRCEDVTFGQLQTRSNWTDAKLHTRCGMGPCQGRICGPATEALFGWQPTSVRTPLFPIPVAAFCDETSSLNAPSAR